MIEIEHNGMFYKQIEIFDTKNVVDATVIDEIKNKFIIEKCVENSYEVIKRLKTKIVEGFVYCLVPNGKKVDDKVIRHCWNKINNKNFDVTKDYVWPGLGFKAQEFYCFSVMEFEYKDYIFNPNNLFHSNAPQIAAEIEKKLKEEKNK